MHIVIYNWRDITHPKGGGGTLYTHEVARRLVNYGHRVTLICGNYRVNEVWAKGKESIDGVNIVRLGNEYTTYLLGFKYYMEELRRAHDFDIVVEGINTIPFFTPVYVNGPKVSLIFQLTGEVFYKVFPKPIGAFAHCVEPFIYKKLYKKMVALVLSRSIKEELVKIGFVPENVFVAEPGVDCEYYNLGDKAEYPNVLYFNRVVPYKNVDHVIKAFKMVKQKVPGAKLYIVGCRGSRYESNLRRLAGRLNLLDSIEFHDFVGGELKRRFLQMAWVHVLPSTKEGWGISVLESAACGSPTVAYNVAGLRDSVRHKETGLLVPFNDINALATAITEILMDGELRGRTSQRAREWATQFSWEKTAKITLSALEYAMTHCI